MQTSFSGSCRVYFRNKRKRQTQRDISPLRVKLESSATCFNKGESQLFENILKQGVFIFFKDYSSNDGVDLMVSYIYMIK